MAGSRAKTKRTSARAKQSQFIANEAGSSEQDLHSEPELHADGEQDSDDEALSPRSPTPKRRRPTSLSVKELKQRLKVLGLPTDGRKADLQARWDATKTAVPPHTAPQQAAPAQAAHSAAGSFDLDAFLSTGQVPTVQQPPPTQQQPATAAWNATNQAPTMVGFTMEPTGSILCTDPAFPGEFKERSNQEFASTRAQAGASEFTYSKGGDVRLTVQTILLKCNNNTQQYMDETVAPLLKTYNFRPVVQGVYKKVRLQLKLQKNSPPAGGYKVSGDTAFVHFNGVFDFKAGAPPASVSLRGLTFCLL